MTEMTPTDRVPTNGQRIYESGDHALGKEFYHDPVSDKVMVRITVPGDKWFEPHYAAEAEWQPGITYRDRFPEQWGRVRGGHVAARRNPAGERGMARRGHAHQS